MGNCTAPGWVKCDPGMCLLPLLLLCGQVVIIDIILMRPGRWQDAAQQD